MADPTGDPAGPDKIDANPNPYLELRAKAEDPEFPNDWYEDTKVFTIPTNGSVFLYGPEIAVVDTPEFQRLSGIKQLGLSYLVYRGATHTRFEHSIGTLDMAQRMTDAIRRNPKQPPRVQIPNEAIRLIRLSALLHDITHIPFGHTLEDEFHLMAPHDDNEDRMNALLDSGQIGAILSAALGEKEFEQLRFAILPSLNPGVGAENARLTRKDGGKLRKDQQIAMLKYPYVADIVGNTVCADLLDYTARDMHNTGLVGAVGDRFLQYLSITDDERMVLGDTGAFGAPSGHLERDSSRVAVSLDKRGMPRPDVESEILKLLTYRYELAERVYLHHAKNAASAMLVRAVQLLRLNEVDENFHWLGDDLLLRLVAQPDLAERFRDPASGRNLQLLAVAGADKHVDAASDDERPLELVHDSQSAAPAAPKTVDFRTALLGPGDARRASELGQALLERRLYKIAYLGVYDDLKEQVANIAEDYANKEGRVHLEDLLARKAGLNESRVVVHCPTETMMEKIARVRVRSTNGVVQTLDSWDGKHAGRIAALNDAHRRLWRIAVYTHPDTTGEQVALIRGAMSDLLHDVESRYNRVMDHEPTSGYWGTLWDQEAPLREWRSADREEVLQGLAARGSDADLTRKQAIALLDETHQGILSRSASPEKTGGSGTGVGPQASLLNDSLEPEVRDVDD